MLELANKRVTLLGMGRSSTAATRLLLRHGARPFVSEQGDGDALLPHRMELEALNVPYEVGGHGPQALSQCDLAVLSPGVPAAAPPVGALLGRGVPVLAELELAWHFCRSRILAVTGTNGKTTATEMLRAMIAACGHSVSLAGNNGATFSAAVMREPAPSYMVLEVSSYQLETVHAFRPWIGAVLNLTPDHLGRHHTLENYGAVKNRIFARQQPGDMAVVNMDDPRTRDMQIPEGVARRGFSLEQRTHPGLWLDGDVIRDGEEGVALRSDIPLPGEHNVANALAALAMMRAGGFFWDKVIEGLRQFQGVEHRIEWVARIGGVDFYNDSKSTNIDSLRVALASFERPVVLIAGGQGKGAAYDGMAPLVGQRVKMLVGLGEDGPAMAEAWKEVSPSCQAGSMEDAVALARAHAGPDWVVLLSPGCASFDMYKNFEERGRDFKHWVKVLSLKAGGEEEETHAP